MPEFNPLSIILYFLNFILEYDELMAVRNELEQRKRSEYKEMEDLREEIATMQTLYQYRYNNLKIISDFNEK